MALFIKTYPKDNKVMRLQTKNSRSFVGVPYMDTVITLNFLKCVIIMNGLAVEPE